MLAVAVALLVFTGIQCVAIPSALGALSATSCPSSSAYDFVSQNWTDGGLYDVAGVRAPVETRLDGTVCSGGPVVSEDSAWIGIEPSSANQIAQIGFVHQAIAGGSEFCRFWAIGSGVAHDYGCSSQTNRVYVYFEVMAYVYARSQYYYLKDCGTGGYGSCTVENAGQTAFASPWGLVSAESSYGKSACTTQIMGSSSYPQNSGTSSNPLEWQNAVGGTWATRVLAHNAGMCSDYKGGFSNQVLSAWDSRNSN